MSHVGYQQIDDRHQPHNNLETRASGTDRERPDAIDPAGASTARQLRRSSFVTLKLRNKLGNTLIEVDKSGPTASGPVNGDERGKWLFRNLTGERGQRLGEEAITFARYFAYVPPNRPYPLTISPRGAVGGREDATLMRHWLFEGTHLALGESIPDVLAGDLDAINPASNLPAHRDLVILHSEVDWGDDPPVVPNDMVLLERPNGQLTFHSGTWYMAKVIMSNAPADPKLRRLVSNALSRMLGTPYDLPH